MTQHSISTALCKGTTVSKVLKGGFAAAGLLAAFPAQAGLITFDEPEFAGIRNLARYTPIALSDIEVGLYRNTSVVAPTSGPQQPKGNVAYAPNAIAINSLDNVTPFSLISFDFISSPFVVSSRATYVFSVQYTELDGMGDEVYKSDLFEINDSDVFTNSNVQLNLSNITAATIRLESGAPSSNYAMFDNIFYQAGPIVAGAVPEPATWALFILGFGTVGATMRQRKTRTSLSYC